MKLTHEQREAIISDLQSVRLTDWTSANDTPLNVRECSAADLLDCVLKGLAEFAVPEEPAMLGLPDEPTPEMIEAVSTILQPYAAKLVWKRMLGAALIADRSTQHPEGESTWRYVEGQELPDGAPVDPDTTLFAFDEGPGHWEYKLPPLPTAAGRKE